MQPHKLQQKPTKRRAQHACTVIGTGIECHGHTDPVQAGRITNHRTTGGIVRRGEHTAQKRTSSDMPHRRRLKDNQHAEYHRRGTHRGEADELDGLATYPISNYAEPGAEKNQRRPTKEQEDGDDDGRPCQVEDENPHSEGLEPPHRAGNRTRIPQPPEGRLQEKVANDRSRRCTIGHGGLILRRNGDPAPPLAAYAMSSARDNGTIFA